MRKTIIILALIFLYFLLTKAQYVGTCSQYPVSSEIKEMPVPPVGQRWVLNNRLSDEFNSDILDNSKWYPYNPNWIGRAPGLFMESQVSLKDGYLRLKGSYMDKDTIIYEYGKSNVFNIATACITSRERDAGFGYYECKFKANKTTLSTAFWMTSKKDFTYDLQPHDSPPGRFSQELDICECIGKGGDFKGNRFSFGMNSHVHYWFTSLKGIRQNITAYPVLLRPKDKKSPSEEFNIYGCWWKDKNSAAFYLNNEQSHDVSFCNIKNRDPFYFPLKMNVILSVETYPHPWVTLPSRKELSNDSINTSYYDWIRSYFLIDVFKDDPYNNSQYVFNDRIFIANKKSLKPSNNTIKLNIHYTTPQKTFIDIFIYNMNNIKQYYKKIEVLPGFGNIEVPIQFNARKGKTYKIVSYIENTNDTQRQIIGDSFLYRRR